MHTIDEVKQELIEHLYRLDKTKMSVSDLRTYADTVQMACNAGVGFNQAAVTKEDG